MELHELCYEVLSSEDVSPPTESEVLAMHADEAAMYDEAALLWTAAIKLGQSKNILKNVMVELCLKAQQSVTAAMDKASTKEMTVPQLTVMLEAIRLEAVSFNGSRRPSWFRPQDG